MGTARGVANISGIAGFHGSGNEALLSALATALDHRGPNELLGVEGRAGLAIRSVDPDIASDDDGAVAVADANSGAAAQAVKQYAAGGVDALATLVAAAPRLALALYDPATETLVLARDTIGAAPLYYVTTDNGLVFASEPVALVKAGAVAAAPDTETVARFVLTGRSDDTEATFFAGIRRVMPGQVVVVAPSGATTRQLRDTHPMTLPVGNAIGAAFEGTGNASVRFGHGLAGAALVTGAPTDAPVFTASFRPMDTTEDSYVDTVLGALSAGGRHQRIDLNTDSLVADLPAFIAAQGEPVADLESYLQFAIAREAAERGATMIADPAGIDVTIPLPAYSEGKRARKPVEPASLVKIAARSTVDTSESGALAAARRVADRNSAHAGIAVTLPYSHAIGSADNVRALIPAPARAAADQPRYAAPMRDWLLRLKNRIYGTFMEESFVVRDWFHQQAVMVAFEDFIKGRNADAALFWRIWQVELWAREFFDPKPVEDAEPVRVKGPLEPNANKQLEITVDGERWIRFPIRTDLFIENAPYADRITGYARDLVREATADPRYAECFHRPWYLLVSEKIVAISQGRSYFIWDIEPSWWARTLSKFVVRTPYGIGLGSPWTMELAIREAGLPRILFASGVSAAGKAIGKRGLFYQVVGHSVRAIDGPTEYSVYPANVSAKLAPAKPDKVSEELAGVLKAALESDGRADLARTLAGVVVIDANDIGRNVLGKHADRPAKFFEDLFGDNPLGQGSEQTPLAVAVQVS